MNRSKLILAIVLSQVFTATVFAAGVWSGPGTTFQEWSFNTNSATPSSDDSGAGNPYGTPSCYIGDRAVYSTDTWALNRDEMDFFIPNNPELNARKEMQIEIEWIPGSGQSSGGPVWPKRPLLSVYPEYAPPNDGLVVFPDISILQQGLIPGSNLTKTVFGVVIEPNPVDEWVVLKGDIVVDHVAISTYCGVPEPATLGLLIGGAFMAIRRSRKKD
jgi:hypothetical protein